MKGMPSLTEQEIESMLKALAELEGGKRNVCLFVMGLKTGFRISELLSIKVKDVIQAGKVTDEVKVAKQHIKKQTESRIVPLHPLAKKAIKAWVDELMLLPGASAESYLFPPMGNAMRVLTRCAVNQMIDKAKAKANIRHPLGTHCMRKTFANVMWEKLDHNILDVRDALGHVHVTSTEAYLKANSKKIKAAMVS